MKVGLGYQVGLYDHTKYIDFFHPHGLFGHLTGLFWPVTKNMFRIIINYNNYHNL